MQVTNAMGEPSDPRLAGYRPPPRQPKPGEVIFEFVRASDGAQIRCKVVRLAPVPARRGSTPASGVDIHQATARLIA